MSLSLFLRDENFNIVKELSYGERVKEEVDASSPDIVLLDIMLKGDMDGIEAALEVRATSEVPILFLSALSDKSTMNRLVQVSNSDFLVKPYDYDVLKDKMLELIEKYKS